MKKNYSEYFHLEYQSIVDEWGNVSSIETLSRLKHPQLGNIPPLDFIPVIENTGHIMQFGCWVLENALNYVKELRKSNPELSIAVNVSPIQLKDDYFYKTIQRLLLGSGVPANALTLEITESVLEDTNLEGIISQIELLKNIGVNIHIDDFGTGYSSLTRLRTLPAHTLKIDRSFVVDMATQGDGLIKGILSIAGQFNLDIIVEGVETEEQFIQLKALGCTKFQGFYFSMPNRDADLFLL